MLSPFEAGTATWVCESAGEVEVIAEDAARTAKWRRVTEGALGIVLSLLLKPIN